MFEVDFQQVFLKLLLPLVRNMLLDGQIDHEPKIAKDDKDNTNNYTDADVEESFVFQVEVGENHKVI